MFGKTTNNNKRINYTHFMDTGIIEFLLLNKYNGKKTGIFDSIRHIIELNSVMYTITVSRKLLYISVIQFNNDISILKYNAYF